MSVIPVRLGLQQRVLPDYRAAFFEALAAACPQGLSLFAGQPRPEEMIISPRALKGVLLAPARNRHISRGRTYLCWQNGLTDWLDAWRPQALILEANPRYLSNWAAMRWMHARRRPVIGWGLGAPGGSLPSALRRQYLRRFDALITYSRQGAAEYAAAGFPAEAIFVAPNAAVPRPAHELPERKAHFVDGRAALLFVGRLQARKRIDSLLRACAALPAAQQPRLCVVGDGPERAALQTLAGQIYPQAEFPGALRGTELEPYYRAADLFVLPGTGGLALQQAMAYGLPLLAAEADGTQNDLVRAENGWRLPPGDEAALTVTLAEALRDPVRLRRMGAVSYQIVRDEINIDAMVAAFAAAVDFAGRRQG